MIEFTFRENNIVLKGNRDHSTLFRKIVKALTMRSTGISIFSSEHLLLINLTVICVKNHLGLYETIQLGPVESIEPWMLSDELT